MKKIVAFLMVSVLVLCMVGCAVTTYKLPDGTFCTSYDGTKTYELNQMEKLYIIDILNNASWMDDVPNCHGDFMFHTQDQKINYHPEHGMFVDYTNGKCTELTEEQCIAINAMLGI